MRFFNSLNTDTTANAILRPLVGTLCLYPLFLCFKLDLDPYKVESDDRPGKIHRIVGDPNSMINFVFKS